MSEDFQRDSITYIRRHKSRRPSVKGHAIKALASISIIGTALWFGYQFLGNENDAIVTGEVAIEAPVIPAASDNLEGNGTDLPDLLKGQVPDGANPTELTDALGNPLSGKEPVENALVGQSPQTNSQENISTVQPIAVGPKTILIDGKPLEGGGFPTSALPRAPLADITRTSPWGQIPKISATGKKAVTSYARPFEPTKGKKQVSVIIGGLGIDRNLTRRIINELPPEVTLSFAAHTNSLQTWVHQARDRGHEVIIELPMEGYSFNPSEPGAGRTLKADSSAADNIRNLDFLLSRAQGYFAVTNYNGDRLIDSPSALSPIMLHLSNAGIGFIYDGSSEAPSLIDTATSTGITYDRAYAIIDKETDLASVQSELAKLEIASNSGAQIGIGFALPETFMAVKNWVTSLDAKGMELAPASYVLNQ